MDAAVIKRFCDRLTGRIYKVGETFTGDAERVSELAQGGWVQPTAKPKKRKKK